MTLLERILECYSEESLLVADGFNDAVIGIEDSSLRLIYSVRKCVELISADMSEEDAYEYFEFNVRGSFVGDRTPIWCEDFFN